jgi:hypothetical protein
MRRSALSLLAILLFVGLAWSQLTEVPSAQTRDLPMYRPILIGTTPDALINRIDTQDLMKKGQKDAFILFICSVRKSGELEWSRLSGGTPDSKPLEDELRKRLSAAADQRFIPAIYNHRPVDAIYYGTVVFSVVNGKPPLRIFYNK